MSFIVNSAPAVIQSFSAPKDKTRMKDTQETPQRMREIAIDVDVTDPSFYPQLDKVFPGFSILLKAMAGENDNDRKSPAAEFRIAKTLPNMIVVVMDNLGNEILKVGSAKAKGKPVLRIGHATESVTMPLRVMCPLTKENVATLLDWQGADVFVEFGEAQLDYSDIGQSQPNEEAKPKTTRRSKSKVNVVVDDVDNLPVLEDAH